MLFSWLPRTCLHVSGHRTKRQPRTHACSYRILLRKSSPLFLTLLGAGCRGARTVGGSQRKRPRLLAWSFVGSPERACTFPDIEPSDNLARSGVLVSNFASQKFAPVPRLARSRVSGSEDSRRSQRKRPRLLAWSFVGSPCWTRTSDTLINSQVLYRLS